MGVSSLWELIEGVRKTRKLNEISGLRVAIDMSPWLVSGAYISEKNEKVCGGHLRLIFTRLVRLLKNGVNVVAVFDGVS